jgi:HK97 family phage major capsid protein
MYMEVSNMASNRTILEKADLRVQDLITSGGYLPEAVAQKFMEIAVEESVLLKQITVKPMKSHDERIDSFRFGNRVLFPGAEATALPVARRSKPDLYKTTLSAKLFKGEIRLSKEVLEDNIEGEAWTNTLVGAAGKAVSRDIEDVVWNGDTASVDPTLAVLDGLRKQSTTNIVNAASSITNKTVLKSMVKAMPVEFITDRRALRFMTSVDSETDYRDSLADRATAVGDKFLLEGVPATYSGIPMFGLPIAPENIGAGSVCTEMILGDPKNAHLGFWRNIEWETDKDIVAGELIIVVTLRMDVKWAFEPATVKAQNVKVT